MIFLKKLIPYILIIGLLFGTIMQQYYINSIKAHFTILIKTVEELGKPVDKTFLESLIIPHPDFNKLKFTTAQVGVGKKGGAGIVYKIDNNYLYVLTAKHILRNKGEIKVDIYNNKKEHVLIRNISRTNIFSLYIRKSSIS